MVLKSKYILLFIIVFSFITVTVNADEKPKPDVISADALDKLHIITEIYPPYNFKYKGELYGISVDIMVLILKKTGSKLTR